MNTSSFKAWPALLDLLAATLIVFLLISFVQEAFSIDELESMLRRQQQETFYRLISEEFEGEVQKGRIFIQIRPGELLVTFSDQVLFDSADYRLKKQGRVLIKRWRRLFIEADEGAYERVQVEGHTDHLPLTRRTYPSNNWQLSAARAISVIELLAEHPDLDGRRFSANAFSSYRPITTNETTEGQALNRRIEMRIFFDGRSGEPREPPGSNG